MFKIVGKKMNYQKDGGISRDSTFGDHGREIRSHWTFSTAGTHAKKPYVDGKRQGMEFFYLESGLVCLKRFYQHDCIHRWTAFYSKDAELAYLIINKGTRNQDVVEGRRRPPCDHAYQPLNGLLRGGRALAFSDPTDELNGSAIQRV